MNRDVPSHRSRRTAILLVALVTIGGLLPEAALFEPPTAAAAASYPSVVEFGPASNTGELATGDMNSDGRLDVVIGAQLLLNNGTATPFASVTAQAVGDAPGEAALAIGDVDGDSHLDVVIGARLYRNNRGAAPFDGVNGTAIGDATGGAIALGDLNDDGRLDAVIGAALSGADGSDPVAIGRLDDDAYPDIVVGPRVYKNGGPASAFAGVSAVMLPEDLLDVDELALGDLNGDGRLDIVIGTQFSYSHLLLNPGAIAGFATAALNEAGPDRFTTSIQLGDADGDGDLDLLVGSDVASGYRDPTLLLLNNGTETPFGPASTRNVGEAAAIRTVAFGDVDGDGDLDVLTGVESDSPRLARNTGLPAPFPARAATTLADGNSFSLVALGDVTGDGHLDLVRANALVANNGSVTPFTGAASALPVSGEPYVTALGDLNRDGFLDVLASPPGQEGRGQVLINNRSSTPFAGVSASAVGAADTYITGAVLGDMDGDGWLDLVQAPEHEHGLYLLLNNRTDTPFDGVTASRLGSGTSQAIALGDLEGDGDLDIISGTAGGTQLLFNKGGSVPFEGVEPVTLELDNNVVGVAAADLDGDGDLDVAEANTFAESFVYLNNGGATPFDGVTAQAIDSDVRRITSLAAGDLDNDGDVDLAFGGNGADPTWLVYNNGGSAPFSGVQAQALGTPAESGAANVLLGDVDADGDLDLLRNNIGEPTRVHRNDLFGRASLPNDPPTVSFANPARIDRAALYGSPLVRTGASVEIPYRLADAEGDAVRRVQAFYSLDGGDNWRPARAAGTQTENLAAPPAGENYTYTWDLFTGGDLSRALIGQSPNVIFRIEALTGGAGRGGAAGVSQRAATSATSQPFAVRGVTPRVQRAGGAPVRGALVFALPPGQSAAAPALPARRYGSPELGTDVRGLLQGRPELAAQDRFFAIERVSPTSVTTYTLYHASAAPAPDGLATTAVSAPGVQTLTISPQHQLLLLNLTVSLEWDARGDGDFLDQLEVDLKRASAYLYDWSDGQVALGTVKVYQNKQLWYDTLDAGRVTQKGADIRVLATNRLRPSAGQGGIVTAELRDPDRAEVVYERGPVQLGAVWNRDASPRPASDSTDWARALAHELGHYALFLDDNYLGLDSAKRLIAVDGCTSAMSDPYRDEYSEFHPQEGWVANCAQTLSQATTGRSDWQTVERLGPRVFPGFTPRAPGSFGANHGPSLLPLDLTTVERQPVAGSTRATRAIDLKNAQSATASLSPAARAVLFGQNSSRIVELGQPVNASIRARGIQSGDRLCVFDLPSGQLGCGGATGTAPVSVLPRATWQPDVIVSAVTSRTVTLRVPVGGVGTPAPSSLTAVVLPTDSTLGSADVTLERSADGAEYSGTARFGDAVLEAAIHVFVPDDGSAPAREIVTAYSLGGNPAPRRRPRPRSRRRAPMTSADGGLVLYTDATNFSTGQFFAIQNATVLPDDPYTAEAIGPGYRLLVSDPALFQQPVGLTLAYAQGDVSPDEEEGIAVYYQPPGGTWRRLATQLDTENNEAVAQAEGAGLYALMDSALWELGPGLQQDTYRGVTSPMPDALQPISGVYTHIYGYDPDDPGDPWKAYVPDAPPWVNQGPDGTLELAQLVAGENYYVNVARALVAPIKPKSAPAAVLAPAPALFYGVLRPEGDFRPAAGLTVTALVGDTECASTTARQVASEIVWVLDVPAGGGCGFTGAEVRFVAGEHALPEVQRWDNRAVNGRLALPVFLPITGR